MKTIEQLLELTKNPYYKFTREEQEVLDNFLAQKQATPSKRSQGNFLNKSSKQMPVTVRNVVPKVDTYAPEAHESVS